MRAVVGDVNGARHHEELRGPTVDRGRPKHGWQLCSRALQPIRAARPPVTLELVKDEEKGDV